MSYYKKWQQYEFALDEMGEAVASYLARRKPKDRLLKGLKYWQRMMWLTIPFSGGGIFFITLFTWAIVSDNFKLHPVVSAIVAPLPLIAAYFMRKTRFFIKCGSRGEVYGRALYLQELWEGVRSYAKFLKEENEKRHKINTQ